MNEKEIEFLKGITQEYGRNEVKQSEVDKIKSLDKKVKTPALIFTYTSGIIGALVLGLGMSLAMGVIGNSMALGIVIGVIGMVLVGVNYPIYTKILKARKKKYANEIIKLANDALNVK